MSKEQVMDYVMNSPANTNPNVLSGMLDGISGTQLPSPTESDNGKVLGVDGGEYKLVEQSGGAEVSKIELVTVGGSSTTIANGSELASLYRFSGGGDIPNGKTVADIIGDKQIVGLEMVPTSGSAIAFALFTNSQSTDLRGASKEKLAQMKSITVGALTQGTSNSYKLYAICI